MAKDRMILIYKDFIYVFLRKKVLFKDVDVDVDRALKDCVCKIAPPRRVCVAYIAPVYRSLNCVKEAVEALKNNGYTNIRLLPTYAKSSNMNPVSAISLTAAVWNETIKLNDYVVFFNFPETPDDGAIFIYQKRASGFELVDAEMTYPKQIDFFTASQSQNDERIALVIADTKFGQVDNVKKLVQNMIGSNYKIKTPISEKGTSLRRFVWCEYDNKKDCLFEKEDLEFHLDYGWDKQHLNIPFSDIPCSKQLELDIQDASTLEVSVSLDRTRDLFEHVHTFDYFKRFERKVKVTINIPITGIPEVNAEIVDESPPVEHAIYAIEWDHKTNLFTGTHITADSRNTVSNPSDIKSVVAALADYKPECKLRGVFLNYPGVTEFPHLIHKEVIEALPLPTPKIRVAGIHSDFSLYLKDAGIKPAIKESVVLVDRRGCNKLHYFFTKTKNGFNYIKNDKQRYRNWFTRFDYAVIIHDELSTDDPGKTFADNMLRFQCKELVFPPPLEIEQTELFDFAWDYFTGGDFHGYMVRDFLGAYIELFHGDTNILSSCGCLPIKLNRCITANAKPDALIHYQGYPSIYFGFDPINKFGVMKITVQENLLPTLSLGEANNSLVDLDNHRPPTVQISHKNRRRRESRAPLKPPLSDKSNTDNKPTSSNATKKTDDEPTSSNATEITATINIDPRFMQMLDEVTELSSEMERSCRIVEDADGNIELNFDPHLLEKCAQGKAKKRKHGGKS